VPFFFFIRNHPFVQGQRDFKIIYQPDVFRVPIRDTVDENAIVFMLEVSHKMVGSHNYAIQMVAEFSQKNAIDEFFVLRHDKRILKALQPPKSTQKVMVCLKHACLQCTTFYQTLYLIQSLKLRREMARNYLLFYLRIKWPSFWKICPKVRRRRSWQLY
jgi:hypothetical protein